MRVRQSLTARDCKISCNHEQAPRAERLYRRRRRDPNSSSHHMQGMTAIWVINLFIFV